MTINPQPTPNKQEIGFDEVRDMMQVIHAHCDFDINMTFFTMRPIM